MRKRKALVNIMFSLLLELVTIISGFIVPRLIIGTYGSATNGLVNSITQFLGYIALLQSGVGSVIRASLYKPLSKKDHNTLCVMVKTAENFFKKIAYATVGYIVLLAVVFPMGITQQYDVLFTVSLVVIIGISTCAQYFWGITYQMVLEADQCSYIYSAVQIITVVLNAVFTVLLINAGCSIQTVKLASAVLFVARPLVINYYAKRKYKINTRVSVDNSLIAQRWDGVAQAIAYFVHTKSAVFILTVMSSLENVSVYSVYMLVTSGLTSLLNCIDKAIRAAFGNIIANNEKENLQRTFTQYSTVMHILATIFFSTASITIFKFVEVYTEGITDAQYIQKGFGLMLLAAEYLYCLRLPYYAIINAAGKFRETKRSAILEALVNVAISVVCVWRFGLIGVAVGIFIAMLYRTVSFVIYLHKEVLMLQYKREVIRYIVSIGAYIISIGVLSRIDISVSGYFQWIVYAGLVFICVSVFTLILNLIFKFNDTRMTLQASIKTFKKKTVNK